jgi:hypothetical protein
VVVYLPTVSEITGANGGPVETVQSQTTVEDYLKAAFIEYYELAAHYSHMAQGFVMLMFAVFGMRIGILYQAVQLMKGKSLAEIIVEVKETFSSIFK